jgi:hypothetical protein
MVVCTTRRSHSTANNGLKFVVRQAEAHDSPGLLHPPEAAKHREDVLIIIALRFD